MTIKLVDRINAYIANTNYRLLNKVPVIINVNGRAFSKITTLLDKPYSNKFAEALTATASRLIQEIEGATFAYIFNDEIVIVSRNDQHSDTQPWLNNEIQKISSIVSAISSQYFNNYSASINLDIAEAIFTTQVFAVPNMTEVINTLICKQQQNLQNSVQSACEYGLLKKGFDKSAIEEMTSNISREEKISLLEQKCHIHFNDYPMAFRYGVACYKKPQIIEYEGQEIVKNKWHLDVSLPLFASNQEFLKDILKEKS